MGCVLMYEGGVVWVVVVDALQEKRPLCAEFFVTLHNSVYTSHLTYCDL